MYSPPVPRHLKPRSASSSPPTLARRAYGNGRPQNERNDDYDYDYNYNNYRDRYNQSWFLRSRHSTYEPIWPSPSPQRRHQQEFTGELPRQLSDDVINRLSETSQIRSFIPKKLQKLASRFLRRMPIDEASKYLPLDDDSHDIDDDYTPADNNIVNVIAELRKINVDDDKRFKSALKMYLSPELINKYSSGSIRWLLYAAFPHRVYLISRVLKKKGI